MELLTAALLDTRTPVVEMLARLGMAVVFGAVIGFDREARAKPAGLRTHMLISLAAALFTLLTFELTMTAVAIDKSVGADPVRVIQAVVAGVAFLGAGTIIQSRGQVHGITTGASIWLAGAVGMACGGGYYTIALIALVFAILILSAVGFLERRLKPGVDKPPTDE